MRTDILEEHADEAMFLFEHRRRTLVSLTVEADFLVGLDERLVAHLDGLVVAGDEGWKIAEALLRSEEPAGPFVGTAVALLGEEARGFDALETALIAAKPQGAEAINAALRLFPRSFVAGERAPRWLARPEARLRAGALVAFVGAGGPARVFAPVLTDRAAAPLALRSALEGAMHSRDRSLAPFVTALEDHPDAEVRAAALEATVLLAGAPRGRDRARRQLAVAEDSVAAARALGLVGEVTDAVALARALPDATPSAARALLLALGSLGSGDAVDALLGFAAGEDAKARLAAFSLRRVLGSAVEWCPRAPLPASSSGAADSEDAATWTFDDELPLWSLEPIGAAWHKMSARFAAGARFRHGAPFVARAPSARTPLGLRQYEALELALADPAARLPVAGALTLPPPFSWRAPAPAAEPRSRRA